MKYLFFDIECSNCFGGIGKICEFGYVLTDENFKVLYKNAIPMSPGKGRENRFNLTGRKDQRDIVLAWDYDYYFEQPEFPHFYNIIKKLMSDEDTICFAFGGDNDISYLYSTLKRYKLKTFDYICYDVQEFGIKYLNVNQMSLKKMYIKFVGVEDIAKLQEHFSRDDAFMTMKIFESICKFKNVSSKNLLNEFENTKITFNSWLENKIASEHVDKDAVSNMSVEEEIQFKHFVLDLNKLAESNRNNEVAGIVTHKDAFKAQYIVGNIKLFKDGDAFLFLTSMTLLNTYVKQKDHDIFIEYWFKDILNRLLLESKHTIFKSLKINYINKEKNGNNLLIFEFYNCYQFSFHCVDKKFSKLIYKEYKCNRSFWGIKNKTFINELFNRTLSNNVGFSNLTINDEELLKRAEDFGEEMSKHVEFKPCDLKVEVKGHNNKGKNKIDSRSLWKLFYDECLNFIDDPLFIGKHYEVSKYIKDDICLTRLVIEKLKESKCLAINSVAKSNFLIVINKIDQMRFESIFKEPYKGKYVLLEDFIKNSKIL